MSADREIAIRAEGLGKRYRIGSRPSYHMVQDEMAPSADRPLRETPRRRMFWRDPNANLFWALRDVGFEVESGEVVGIIGKNGSGKSTLLRILSRITEPTAGYAEIRGRVASLLEVGTGFHPELTGRENVYLNGSILGMKRSEVRAQFDAIVAFSGVEEFLDTPVKRYSSGMHVRLAFAVTAHLQPEILLIDEVLAVGDEEFQRKCLTKMADVARSGRTVVFVSHNMAAVKALCSRTILLKKGQMVCDGSTSDTIQRYLEPTEARPAGGPLAKSEDGSITLLSFEPVTTNAQPIEPLLSGQDVVFRLLLHSTVDIGESTLTVSIDDAHGVRIAILSNLFFTKPVALNARYNVITCHVPELPLTAGRYHFSIKLTGQSGVLIWAPHILSFDVEKGDFFGSGKMIDEYWVGSTLIKQSWDVTSSNEAPAGPGTPRLQQAANEE